MNVSGNVQGKDIVAQAWSLPPTNYFATATEFLYFYRQSFTEEHRLSRVRQIYKLLDKALETLSQGSP